MSNLNDQYNQIVEQQRDYLNKVQAAFDQRCDEITQIAQEKLAKIPEENRAERQKVFEEQKKQLNEALTQLRTAIDHSGTQTRIHLENMHTKREEEKIKELEEMIKKL